MHRITRNLRGLVVALATLALSAGVVLAARPASVEVPAAAGDGLTRASEASGKTVPVGPAAPALPEADEDEDVDEEVDEAVPEVNDEDEDEVEPSVEEGERPQNHGWFVSEAATGATPEGFDNHGEYVSEIARGDDGKPEAAAAARETGSAASDAATTARERGSAAAEAAKTRKADRAPQNARGGND